MPSSLVPVSKIAILSGGENCCSAFAYRKVVNLDLGRRNDIRRDHSSPFLSLDW
jgi:hypothetical protein